MDELKRRWDDKGWKDSLNCGIKLIDQDFNEVKKYFNHAMNLSVNEELLDDKNIQ